MAPIGGVSPFSETLEIEPVNPGVKITGLESYNGTSDPNDHLSYYENLMVCHRYNDITCCRLFVSTFKSYARTRFSCLPPRSIHSWNEFKTVFLAKFRINVPQAVHTISLENMKQTRGETLRSYIDRFKVATSKVRDLCPAVAVDSFIRNMSYEECKECCKELCNREPADLYEAYSIASSYIATDKRIRAYYPSSRGEASESRVLGLAISDTTR